MGLLFNWLTGFFIFLNLVLGASFVPCLQAQDVWEWTEAEADSQIRNDLIIAHVGPPHFQELSEYTDPALHGEIERILLVETLKSGPVVESFELLSESPRDYFESSESRYFDLAARIGFPHGVGVRAGYFPQPFTSLEAGLDFNVVSYVLFAQVTFRIHLIPFHGRRFVPLLTVGYRKVDLTQAANPAFRAFFPEDFEDLSSLDVEVDFSELRTRHLSYSGGMEYLFRSGNHLRVSLGQNRQIGESLSGQSDDDFVIKDFRIWTVGFEWGRALKAGENER